MKHLCVVISLVLSLSAMAQAKWDLDNDQSFLSFVSIKKDNIAEAHTFKLLSGGINKKGKAELVIELASVDTLIDIRNERMQAMLFETESFPKAKFTTEIDAKELQSLSLGERKTMVLKGDLVLHGNKKSINTEVSVARISDQQLSVSTRKPIIINAADFGLDIGIEKLREVAQLPSISTAVPVSFTLIFTQER